jgi:hypothetical protein
VPWEAHPRAPARTMSREGVGRAHDRRHVHVECSCRRRKRTTSDPSSTRSRARRSPRRSEPLRPSFAAALRRGVKHCTHADRICSPVTRPGCRARPDGAVKHATSAATPGDSPQAPPLGLAKDKRAAAIATVHLARTHRAMPTALTMRVGPSSRARDPARSAKPAPTFGARWPGARSHARGRPWRRGSERPSRTASRTCSRRRTDAP